MKKIKESFEEVIAGEPTKNHYINVSVVVAAIAIATGLILVFTHIGASIK
jgi:hypothetical protein